MASVVARRAGIALGAGLVARAALAQLTKYAASRPELWQRTNHRGRPVSLVGGPAYVLAATTAVMGAPNVSGRVRAAAVVVAVGAGAVGLYDDLAERTSAKGFAGHFSALRRGEVTTGAVKVAGIGGTSVLAALVGVRGTVVDKLVAGAIIAGAANLANLLDLRPGRAAKAGLLAAAPLAAVSGPAGVVATVTAGAAGGVLADDLTERTMLGDCGANALGALCGLALCLHAGRTGRWAALIALGALNAASERVSFSSVIAANPMLHRLDRWGRQVGPPQAAPDAGARDGSS